MDVTKALRKVVYGVNIDSISLESFGYFLADYVVNGSEITLSGTSVILNESIISFQSNLYRVKQTTLPIYVKNGTAYVDFIPAIGFTVNPAHPTVDYFPMYEVQMDAFGSVVSFIDRRGLVGGLQFDPSYTPTMELIAPDGSVTTEKLADNAVTSAKIAPGSILPEHLSSSIIMGASYVHDQIAASGTWHINHNLGIYPTVFVIDSGGTVVMGDVSYADANNVTISFTPIFSGKAYLR